MLISQSQTITEIAFDGPLSVGNTIALVCVVALLVLVTLTVERRLLGSLTTVGFAILRLTALAAVAWMLLQPNLVRRTLRSVPRSIAIVTDRSGSMDTVDDLDSPLMLAWSDRENETVSALQRASIDLRIGQDIVSQYWLESGAISTKETRPAHQRLVTALDRAAEHLRKIANGSASLS